MRTVLINMEIGEMCGICQRYLPTVRDCPKNCPIINAKVAVEVNSMDITMVGDKTDIHLCPDLNGKPITLYAVENKEKTMTMQKCMELAAQVWRKPSCSRIAMDIDLCKEFAETLHTELNREEGRMKGWEETTKQMCDNASYYRGLVVKIGEMFGDAAYVSDDGSKQIDVLCAKVPELVYAALQKPTPQ